MMNYFPKKFISATKEFTTQQKHVNSPYFRKVFYYELGKQAKIRICGLGFYELYLNGENITKGRLAPYISNPNEALYYDDYDITFALKSGENVIGVWLGNGMQNAVYGDVWDFEKATFRSAPKFAMAYFENDEIIFESNESFKWANSPITFDDLRAGERYDARLEISDWNMLSCDDNDWQSAILAEVPKGEERLVIAEPIMVVAEKSPIAITKCPKGGYIYDFGINFTGVCRLKISGERGQTVKLTHGEVVYNGELDMRNIVIGSIGIRDGFDQCDVYTLKGDGVEIYSPRFTYHGFRYVYVEGITNEQATLDLLTFEIMHSAVLKRGDFSCSDEIVNTIQKGSTAFRFI